MNQQMIMISIPTQCFVLLSTLAAWYIRCDVPVMINNVLQRRRSFIQVKSHYLPILETNRGFGCVFFLFDVFGVMWMIPKIYIACCIFSCANTRYCGSILQIICGAAPVLLTGLEKAECGLVMGPAPDTALQRSDNGQSFGVR